MSCPHGEWHEEDCAVCMDLRRADTAVDEAAVALEIADTEIAKLKAMLRLKWEDLRMLHVAGESYSDWVDDLRDRVGKGWKA